MFFFTKKKVYELSEGNVFKSDDAIFNLRDKNLQGEKI